MADDPKPDAPPAPSPSGTSLAGAAAAGRERLQGALDEVEQAARAQAAEKAAELAARAALASVERAASSLLDGLESAIFGKVGGAAAAVAAEEEADPLERLRKRYGAAEAPKPPVDDPVARAKRTLEEMKRAREANTAPTDAAAAPGKRDL
jgi:hypothetical protein